MKQNYYCMVVILSNCQTTGGGSDSLIRRKFPVMNCDTEPFTVSICSFQLIVGQHCFYPITTGPPLATPR